MPWCIGAEDGSYPALYSRPSGLPDCVILGTPEIMERAKAERKEVGQIRESVLATQKAIGREDRDGARYLSELASDLLKQYRGWDAAIGIMEGREGYHDWRKTKIQEEIAPYVDRAFWFLDVWDSSQPQGASD